MREPRGEGGELSQSWETTFVIQKARMDMVTTWEETEQAQGFSNHTYKKVSMSRWSRLAFDISTDISCNRSNKNPETDIGVQASS